MNHTPGPWALQREEERVIIKRMAGDRSTWIAEVYDPDYGGSILSNARLLVAAPELLASLVRCQEYLGGPWTAPEDVIEQARAAIAKATT